MSIFALGGFAGATFLLPSRAVRGWAYETWWFVYVFIGLVVCPPILCALTVPDFWRVTMSAPGAVLARCIGFGVIWGIGALGWGLMVRYLGIGLGLGIGCGLCAATGALLPPIAVGRAADLVKDTGAVVVLCGVLLSLVGIGFVGLAGRSKEKELPLEEQRKSVPEFNFAKGLATAVVAGLFSAGMNFGLQGAGCIEEAAVAAGAKDCWRGMPVIMVVLWGGFLVEALWCLRQHIRNRTFGDYAKPSSRNLGLCTAVSVLWILQFVCTKAGEPLMGDMKYISFAVMMASTIFFSTLIGVITGEWRGTSRKTRALLFVGTFVLVASFSVMSFGSR